MSRLFDRAVILLAAICLQAGTATAATLLTIPQLQGSGPTSPHVGEIVKTTGVVTGKRKVVQTTFYYAQDPNGDGDAATSDGIVFVAPTTEVKIGDLVTIEGRVVEAAEGRNNLTVTTLSPAVAIKTGDGTAPAPVLLGAGGVALPTEKIAGAGGAIELLERYEGMLVELKDGQVVGPTNERGELWVVADKGAGATGMNAFGGISATETDYNPERLQVQLSEMIADAAPYSLAVGSTIASVAGVLDYSFGNYEIVATSLGDVTPAVALADPVVSAAPGALTIGSYNVENLDPKVETVSLLLAKKDKDDDTPRVATIAKQIVHLLGSPDIVALQEVQDNDGGEVTDVVASDQTLKALIDAIANEDPTAGYEAFSIDPVDDAEGGQVGGNIRVAYLYRPARVQPDLAGAARIADPAFKATRLPLVVPFTFEGKRVAVINVHLSSKGGSDPLYGTKQPPVDGTIGARTAQASAILAYAKANLGATPTVILGDFNSFYYEEPMSVLTAPDAGYANLTETLPEDQRASYIFDGNSQALDHIVVSAGLLPSASLITFHVNSIVPEAEQMSDHDPKLLVLIALP